MAGVNRLLIPEGMKSRTSKKVRLFFMNRDGPYCRLCLKPFDNFFDASMDHIIPVAHGGTNMSWNIQLAHKRCNELKGDRLPTVEELIPWIPREDPFEYHYHSSIQHYPPAIRNHGWTGAKCRCGIVIGVRWDEGKPFEQRFEEHQRSFWREYQTLLKILA